MVTGITDAMLDSVPLVCITGQVSSSLLGTDVFQEADIIGVTLPITKWSYQITRAEEISAVLAKAFHVAQTGRPGPVLVDITKDAQLEYVDFHYEKYTPKKLLAHQQNLPEQALKSAVALINQAKKR